MALSAKRDDMDKILSGGSEPQSWAQSIQAYRRSKTTLPWNPAEVYPPKHVKQFDVSRKTREVDPVLMRHRDPDIESRRREREDQRLRVTLNNAKERQLRVEQKYNIVNNRPHPVGTSVEQDPPAPQRPRRYPDSRTDYDIVNHVPRDNVHSLELIYPEGKAPEVLPQTMVILEKGKKPYSHMKRDVDVLSNRFLEKHDERMVEEQQFLRKQAAEKYRRTHDFNIIAGRYYDDEKERQFVSSRENFEALQGRAQQHRLPPSIRFGEGNEYDIISKKAKDPAGGGGTEDVADRGLNKRVRGREICEENIRQHEAAAGSSEERALNRPSHERHAERLRTGYDVISNEIFTGRTGQPLPPPRTRPPMPVWNRLAESEHGSASAEQQVASSTRELGKATGEGDKTTVEQACGVAMTRGDSGRRRENSTVPSQGPTSARRQLESEDSNEWSINGNSTIGAKQIVPPLDLSRQSEVCA